MRVKLVVLAVALLAFAPVAGATPITVTGDGSFVVNWSYTPTDPDLSATATFTISGWGAAGFTLTISGIQNTTPATPMIGARLTSFGFGLTPNATSVSLITPGSVFTAISGGTFPAFPQVDVCAYSGSNCAGGGNDGLMQGSSDTDSLTLAVAGDFVNGVTFDPLAAKFQTRVGSYEVGYCAPGTPGCDPTIPEPATLLLLGSGLFGGAGLLRRRRR